MNIYLDIDGVLLTKQKQPANHLAAFLKYVTENYTCYWLTTHCKGNAQTAINYLTSYAGTEVVDYLSEIQVTDWSTYKTEAINFTEDFVWLDDYALYAEVEMLKKHRSTDKLQLINLETTPDQLLSLVRSMEQLR